MYIIDANIVLTAKNHSYQFRRVPEFWEWLAHKAENGEVKMPIETWQKVGGMPPERRDDLGHWLNDNKDNLILPDRTYEVRFGDVLSCYAWDDGRPLTDADVDKISDDYALVACAYHLGWTVVTQEIPAPKAQGPNRQIPDICDMLGIPWTDLDGQRGRDGFIDLLDFSTSWNK